MLLSCEQTAKSVGKRGPSNVQEVGTLQGSTDSQFAGGAWDPTDRSRLASIGGLSIQVPVQTSIQSGALYIDDSLCASSLSAY